MHASVVAAAVVGAVAFSFPWSWLVSAPLAGCLAVVTLVVAVRGGPAVAAHGRVAWTHALRSAVLIVVLASGFVAMETMLSREAEVVLAAAIGALAVYLFLAVPAVAVVFVVERRPWRYPLSRTFAPAAELFTSPVLPSTTLPAAPAATAAPVRSARASAA